jgi:hypothetical protein
MDAYCNDMVIGMGGTIKMTKDKSVCHVEPIRAEVYQNGIVYVKPCKVKYTDKHEVHCDKYPYDCEYVVKNYIQSQMEDYEEPETLRFKGEIL